MGLRDNIGNLFNNKETREKEVSAAREVMAEQELQKILSSPVELKNLCSLLNTNDGLHLFNFCTNLKAGKANIKDKYPKASNLVGTARWGSIDNIVNTRLREKEIAKEWHEVQMLGAKAAKGDLHARLTYPYRKSFMLAKMKTEATCQNVYSSCVFHLLEAALATGKIKDIDKLQSMIAKTQVENNNRKKQLGLETTGQSKTVQRVGGRVG